MRKNRRKFLKMISGVGAVGLAGCSGDSNGGDGSGGQSETLVDVTDTVTEDGENSYPFEITSNVSPTLEVTIQSGELDVLTFNEEEFEKYKNDAISTTYESELSMTETTGGSVSGPLAAGNYGLVVKNLTDAAVEYELSITVP